MPCNTYWQKKNRLVSVYSSLEKYLSNPKRIQNKKAVSSINIDWAYVQDMNDGLQAVRILI
jgi:hypothetical protein